MPAVSQTVRGSLVGYDVEVGARGGVASGRNV